jgi:glycosyltransferase involved in cell wall biosynthesis
VAQYPWVNFVIDGPDGGVLTETRHLVERLGLSSNFIFVLLNRSAIPKAHAGCLAFVMPSEYESFGLSVLEAQASGAPVVASAKGGLKQLVVDGETGYVLRKTESQELSRTLLRIMEDHREAEMIGRRARTFSQRFSIDIAATKVEQLYESICSE